MWLVSLAQITGLTCLVGVRFNQLVVANILLASTFPVIVATLSIVNIAAIKTVPFFVYSLVTTSIPLLYTALSPINAISRYVNILFVR